MKTKVLVAIAIFFIPAVIAQTEILPQERGLVLVVNLWDSAVDVQLGDEVVFSLSRLESGSPSQLVEVTEPGPYTLYYKPSSDARWRFLSGEEGRPDPVMAYPYSLTIIRIDRQGTVDILRTQRPMSPGAKIAFLNGSDRLLEEMVLVNTESVPIVRAQDLQSSAITAFFTVEPGLYTGMGDGVYDENETDGPLPLNTEFAEDGWFLIASGSGAGLSVWDLGPMSLTD